MLRRSAVLVATVVLAASVRPAIALTVPVNAPAAHPLITLNDALAHFAAEMAHVVGWLEASFDGVDHTAQIAPPRALSNVASAASPTEPFAPASTESSAPQSGSVSPPNTTTVQSRTITTAPVYLTDVIEEPAQTSGIATRLNALINVVGQLANLISSIPASQSPTALPQSVAADGNPGATGAEAAIDNLSGVTITDANLTASEIPTLDYLPLSGGSLSGDLTVNGNATTSGSSYVNGSLGIGTSSPEDALAVDGSEYLPDITPPTDTANRLYSNGGDLYWSGSVVASSLIGHWTSDGTNAWRVSGNIGLGTSSPFTTLSVVGNGYFTGQLNAGGVSAATATIAAATTSSLFSPIADFTNGIISTLNASVANIVGFTATNATTSSLYITGTRGALLKTDANGQVTAAIAGTDYQAPITTGNLTVGSNLSVSGGSGAVIGSGASISLGSNVAAGVTNDTNVTGTIAGNNLTLGWTGLLGVGRGGTGIGSPSAASILLGNYTGTGWQQLATSSLGLLTTNISEGSNLYFTNARVASYINSSSTIPSAVGGSLGNVLAWNGSNWASAGTSTLGILGSQWTTSGSNISYSSGNVGVGTTSPSANFAVNGSGYFGGGLIADISSSTVIAAGSTAARTLSQRAADVINVKDYGAVCDGVTDDAPAINAAISVVRSRSIFGQWPIGRVGEVVFPDSANGCLIKKSINLTGLYGSGFELDGHGSQNSMRDERDAVHRCDRFWGDYT